MAATGSDYRWIDDWQAGLLINPYCLTFVRHLAPDQVLDRLGAGDRGRVRGALAVGAPAYGAWSAYEGRKLLVAVTPAEGWAVMFEVNGAIGVTQTLMAPVSAGTTTVAHFRNVNALDQFLWLEDGEVALHFEPLFPSQRNGTRATDMVQEMIDAGFDLEEDEDTDYLDHIAAAFALGERITGVQVTPGFLDDSTFVTGLVTIR